MAAITPQYEIGKDVQYFLTPYQQNTSSKVWEIVSGSAEFPLQGRVEDVTISPSYQTQSISPTHIFNANPVIFEGGCTVEIKEARQANANVASGSVGVLNGNVLETCFRSSYVVKLVVKRFDKSGTEITNNRISMILQFNQAPTSAAKNGNRSEASLTTVAIVDSSGAEIANPYFGSGAPF